jgi:hypothetical protein
MSEELVINMWHEPRFQCLAGLVDDSLWPLLCYDTGKIPRCLQWSNALRFLAIFHQRGVQSISFRKTGSVAMDHKIEKSGTGMKVSIVEVEEGLPQRTSRTKRRFPNLSSAFKRASKSRSQRKDSVWPKIFRKTLFFLSVTGVCLGIAYM